MERGRGVDVLVSADGSMKLANFEASKRLGHNSVISGLKVRREGGREGGKGRWVGGHNCICSRLFITGGREGGREGGKNTRVAGLVLICPSSLLQGTPHWMAPEIIKGAQTSQVHPSLPPSLPPSLRPIYSPPPPSLPPSFLYRAGRKPTSGA